MIIPGSNELKAKVDVCAVGTAGLAFLKMVPWPEIAACLAAVYTLLRIAELLVGWFRKKRNA